jgi:hypothetical protein
VRAFGADARVDPEQRHVFSLSTACFSLVTSK